LHQASVHQQQAGRLPPSRQDPTQGYPWVQPLPGSGTCQLVNLL